MALNWSGLPFIFTAGVFTLLSPCSFPLLPAYISYYIGSKTQLGKVVLSGVVCSTGLILVFCMIGLAAVAARALISPYIGLLEIIAGIIIIGLGVAMLKQLTIPTHFVNVLPSRRRGYLGLFFYGIAYGMAAIGCSAPIFFSTVLYAILARGYMDGLFTFIVYALGMGGPLILLTYLIANAKKMLLDKIRRVMPQVQRFSGILLILIGIYLIAFYYYTH